VFEKTFKKRRCSVPMHLISRGQRSEVVVVVAEGEGEAADITSNIATSRPTCWLPTLIADARPGWYQRGIERDESGAFR